MFHFTNQNLKSKSTNFNIFNSLAISNISEEFFQNARNAQTIAHIEVQDISVIFIFFSSKYFITQI